MLQGLSYEVCYSVDRLSHGQALVSLSYNKSKSYLNVRSNETFRIQPHNLYEDTLSSEESSFSLLTVMTWKNGFNNLSPQAGTRWWGALCLQ